MKTIISEKPGPTYAKLRSFLDSEPHNHPEKDTLNKMARQALIRMSVILVKACVCYFFFIFTPNDSSFKTKKMFLFQQKTSFHSGDIQIFAVFSLLSTLRIQKDTQKWNNCLCN